MKLKTERFGSTGAPLAAAACPICFPKLAAVGALFGLGALAPFEVYFLWGAQFLVGLAVAGQIISFRSSGRAGILLLSIVSAVLFFLSLYVVVSEALSYVALGGIVLASFLSLSGQRSRPEPAPQPRHDPADG